MLSIVLPSPLARSEPEPANAPPHQHSRWRQGRVLGRRRAIQAASTRQLSSSSRRQGGHSMPCEFRRVGRLPRAMVLLVGGPQSSDVRLRPAGAPWWTARAHFAQPGARPTPDMAVLRLLGGSRRRSGRFAVGPRREQLLLAPREGRGRDSPAISRTGASLHVDPKPLPEVTLRRRATQPDQRMRLPLPDCSSCCPRCPPSSSQAAPKRRRHSDLSLAGLDGQG